MEMIAQRIIVTEVTGATSPVAVTDATVHAGATASAQSWFSGGERVGYNPGNRAIVAAQDAPLKVFFRPEGDMTHAVTFMPGFPDGSF